MPNHGLVVFETYLGIDDGLSGKAPVFYMRHFESLVFSSLEFRKLLSYCSPPSPEQGEAMPALLC